jgi:predicted nucleotidyltransferase
LGYQKGIKKSINRASKKLVMKKGLQHLDKKEKDAVNSFVRELRRELGNKIMNIRLFGSKVRGDFGRDSDIDIFILVGTKGDIGDRISDIAAEYFLEYNVPLAPVVYSLFEYERNKELGSFFFEKVEKEGVVL